MVLPVLVEACIILYFEFVPWRPDKSGIVEQNYILLSSVAASNIALRPEQ